MQPTTDATRPERRKHFTLWLMFALLFGEIITTFETTMVHAAMPVFVETFGGVVRASWMITAFMLVAASSAAIGGRLGDLYGRGRVLAWVLAISVVGSFVSATAQSFEMIILGRGIQGIAGACLPLMFGLVRQHLPREQAMLGIGIIATTALLAGAAGVSLGGVILDVSSTWRTLFYISGSVGLISVLLTLWLVPREPGNRSTAGKLDLLGGVLFVPGIALALYGIGQARNWGWSDPWTLGMVLAGLAVLGIWMRYELRHRNPLIDVRLLASRPVILANACMVMVAIGAMQAPTLLSLLLQRPAEAGGLALSSSMAGSLIGSAMLIGVVAGPASGFIAARHSPRLSMIIGAGILAAGWVGLFFSHSVVWIIGVLLFVQSVGKGMVFATVPMLLAESVPGDRTSEANGLTAVLRQSFIGVGASIIAVVLTLSVITVPGSGGGAGTTYPSELAFQVTIGLVAGISLLCLLLALALPKPAALRAGQAAERRKGYAAPAARKLA